MTPNAMDWQDDAACRCLGNDVFFPGRDNVDVTDKAKAICRRCPVIAVCLQWALTKPELFGTWGGMTESQRKRMRAARNRRAA
jgi:WhiB family transcriptional regulator, redox-sensing transcriptional regulator